MKRAPMTTRAYFQALAPGLSTGIQKLGAAISGPRVQTLSEHLTGRPTPTREHHAPRLPLAQQMQQEAYLRQRQEENTANYDDTAYYERQLWEERNLWTGANAGTSYEEAGQDGQWNWWESGMR